MWSLRCLGCIFKLNSYHIQLHIRFLEKISSLVLVILGRRAMLNTSMNNEASNSFAFSNMRNTWIWKLLIHHFQAVVDSSTGYISMPDDGATSAFHSPGTLQLHSITFVLGCTKSSALDSNKQTHNYLTTRSLFCRLLNRIIWKFRWNTVVKTAHFHSTYTHLTCYGISTVSSGCQSMASFTSALSHRQAKY
jgi:hypothetical protein